MIAEVLGLISRGALFVVNDSGGKDSQAMKAYLYGIVPRKQLVVVHAHLPEVEWEGTEEFIRDNSYGLEVRTVTAVKTFFEMVDHRQKFPSPSNRQCTSDLKRGPLEKLIRQISKERGNGLIVNCMGMRAEESASRAKKEVFKFSERNSKAGREWYEWMPIHHYTTEQVFIEIRLAGQKPFWIYDEGMTRKSCCFCIMSSKGDLCVAKRLRPELYKRYVDKERELNFSLSMSGKFLDEITKEQK